MDTEDYYCSSSNSSSSSSSSSSPPPQPNPSPKRNSGRKKFRETRHPVYRGVRQRGKGGKWVCELREPNKKSRIWLGTYPTPEMAARAHDVAAIALRGKAAPLNFPNSAWDLPQAESSNADDIRRAAAKAAQMYYYFQPADDQAQRTSMSPEPQLIISTTTTTTTTKPPALTLSTTLGEASRAPVHEEKPQPQPQPQDDEAFLDEEAMFCMPGLLEDMAEGMMLTPPGIQSTTFDWPDGVEMEDITLWTF